MFDVRCSDGFSRWFKTLDERASEEVASALDLLAAANAALGPTQASRLLLWFDGMPKEQQGASLDLGNFAQISPQAVQSFQDFMLWRSEVVRCLESPTFRSRLNNLDAAGASRALAAVEHVKRLVRSAKVELSAAVVKPRQGLSALSAREERVLYERFGGSTSVSAVETVEQAMREALKLVGLAPQDLVDGESGLRELTLTQVTPRLHILYGVDVPNRRILVLLGEPLTRAYYGDSVRFAEQRWREYCQNPQQHVGAP
jgi:hypothetical protein